MVVMQRFQTETTFLRRTLTASLPALLAASQLLLFGPFTLFSSNISEFSLPFSALVGPLLWSLAGLVVILAGLGGCLIGKAFRCYVAVLFALGLALWLQGNLLVADYGLLDGHGFDWQRQAARAPWELALWLGLLLLALIFADRVSSLARFTSGVLITLQLALMGTALINHAAPIPATAQWRRPPKEIFQLSRDQNVIHFIFDAFQSDAFEQLVSEDRAAFDQQLDGFTFFQDHLAAFPTTAMSIPAMLGGEAYRNQSPMRAYAEELLDRQSIFQKLAQQGFEVDVATIVPRYARGPVTHRFSIPKPYTDERSYRLFTTAYLIDIALFRHLPHVLKPTIYNNDRWRLRNFAALDERQYHAANGKAILNEWTARMSVGREGPLYKMIHLGLPHLPVVLDGDCRFTGVVRAERDAYVEQCRCTLRLLGAFLDKLRQLDAYDDALILVTSDHGTALAARGFERTAEDSYLDPLVSSALALLLVKPPGGHGGLTVSTAPTTMTDLPATLFDGLGLAHDYSGESALKLAQDAPRQRFFAHYRWHQENWQAAYFNILQLFSVDGPGLRGSSWRARDVLFSPELQLAEKRIDFGKSRFREHLGLGWGPDESATDSDYVWAMGSLSQVFLSLPQGQLELRWRFETPTFNVPKAIIVRLDDQLLGTIEVRQPGQLEEASLLVPGDLARPRVSRLEFHFSRALRHGEHPELAQELRPLAARFDELVIKER